jgi:hypothetical protein
MTTGGQLHSSDRRSIGGGTVWIAVLLVIAALVTMMARGSGGSEAQWQEIQETLVTGEIQAVELVAPDRRQPLESPAEILRFVQAAVSGTFDEDNPNHTGPTPEITVLFLFGNDEPLALNQWPDGRFELQRGGRQFLIEAPQLAALLEERGIVYR